MKILLTGATGYIGKRLLIALISEGHDVTCMVRDRSRFSISRYAGGPGTVSVIEGDLTRPDTLKELPSEMDCAYYLVHSMATEGRTFADSEKRSAENFRHAVEKTRCQQVIYLSGISNAPSTSPHLESRRAVEDFLRSDKYALTVLRAGIIVGSGSASFEIIRDLAEKLPVMVAPVWVRTPCQPIAVRNVIQFLSEVAGRPEYYGEVFDIAGPDILTYKEMLLQYAEERKLRRAIITVPVLTPRLSGLWLYFITSTSFSLALNLVDSMKVPVIARKNDLAEKLGIKLLPYREAIRLAFDKIEQNDVLSTWKDSFSNRLHGRNIWQFVQVPDFGCYKDRRELSVTDEAATVNRIFGIGGKTGWYHANFLWTVRGYLDRMFGGVGLRRGRRDASDLEPGDQLDFWRVLLASKQDKRLLLFAEMRLPGEAWLEFQVKEGKLIQTATFRPRGIFGRLYWWAMLPFHGYIFQGMAEKLAIAPAAG